MAKQINLLLRTVWYVAVAVLMFGNCILATPDRLKCEGVKCPPMSEITCPEDSQFREYDLSSAEISTEQIEMTEELFHECCVARKCACKLCHIPSCHNKTLVVYEIIPETQIPGKCCGEYECSVEPNCTEVRDTTGYWLTDCQRCKCFLGQRICHRSCDEVMPNPNAAYCKSKSLNRFFPHGETWKDGCYECECQNGEEKCVMPFCKSINCPHEKQITIKGDCCPICWPGTDFAPRHEDDDYFEAEQSALPPLAPPIIIPRPTTTSTTTTTSSSTTTQAPEPPPCLVSEETSATYGLYPVEVVCPRSHEYVLFYVVIFLETVLICIMGRIIWQMRARNHSYNTVSNVDDNFNNCQKISPKIDKLGEPV